MTHERRGCVVTDVRMPGINGLELQECLVDGGFDLPVIVISAYANVPMGVRAMKAGAVTVPRVGIKRFPGLIVRHTELVRVNREEEAVLSAAEPMKRPIKIPEEPSTNKVRFIWSSEFRRRSIGICCRCAV
ncbi:MAG: response regulator [Planctomycetes bacterium]|nr:response regulator [Planctomycetota bacterium]